MDRLKVEEVEPWLLSGKPVVRFAGRDFSQSVVDYGQWLEEVVEACGLQASFLRLADPPGIIVQTYIGDDAPRLYDPILKISKKNQPWLFCLSSSCRNRVSVPGMQCRAHEVKDDV